jgi:AraC-like DNA-binding protein
VPHQVQAITGYQISQHIMPDNIRGKNLRHLLNGKNAIYPENINTEEYYNKFIMCVNENYDCRKAFKIFDETIDHLTSSEGFEGAIDERLYKAMDIISNKISSSISATELAESVHLSEGRFMHLFTEQLGIPLRHYILFQRIALACKIFMEGESLTQAAITAGFSDSAHFTRTFTGMYGIKPSTYAKLKHLFNVHYCLHSNLA